MPFSDVNPSKRLLMELKMLTTNLEVQSYFHYEGIENDKKLKRFVIYGYLLPRTEPYKYGSYKVRIELPVEFPFKNPKIYLLTYIYHPAIKESTDEQRFCTCRYGQWNPFSHISQVIKHCINIIDRPENDNSYCVQHIEARQLYHENKIEYNQRAFDMVKKYSYPRPDQSIISLKFAVKQVIRKQLHFDSTRINQLDLSNRLKQYLNSSLNGK